MYTPLMWAAKEGRTDMVQYFCEIGASLNFQRGWVIEFPFLLLRYFILEWFDGSIIEQFDGSDESYRK